MKIKILILLLACSASSALAGNFSMNCSNVFPGWIKSDGTNIDFIINHASATFYDKVYLSSTAVSVNGTDLDFYIDKSSATFYDPLYANSTLNVTGRSALAGFNASAYSVINTDVGFYLGTGYEYGFKHSTAGDKMIIAKNSLASPMMTFNPTNITISTNTVVTGYFQLSTSTKLGVLNSTPTATGQSYFAEDTQEIAVSTGTALGNYIFK